MDQAETLRKLVQQRGNNCRSLCILSGKGGVGKTTVTVNLACELGKKNKRVLVMDSDIGTGDISFYLKITPTVTLQDVLSNKNSLREAVTGTPYNFNFIPGISGIYRWTNISGAKLKKVFMELALMEKENDFIICDAGSGVDRKVMEFALASDRILLVITPDIGSVMDAYALLKVLSKKECDKPEVLFVLNMVRNQKEAEALSLQLCRTVTTFLNMDIEYCGWLPFEEKISAAFDKLPVCTGKNRLPFAESMKALSCKIINGKTAQPTQSFWQKLLWK